MNDVAEPLRRAKAGPWLVELLPKQAYEARYTPEEAVIGFAFDGQSGSHSFGGDRMSEFRSAPDGLAYVPAGCDVYSCSAMGGEYLKISRQETDAGDRSPFQRPDRSVGHCVGA
jgi:AraC family transcriptional regulator